MRLMMVFPMNVFLTLVLSMAIGALLLTSTPVEAKIYKCVGAGGAVTYSQSKCASEEETSKVLEGPSARERFDCRITRAFSKHVAEEMKAGVSSDDLFSRFGGIDTMAPTSVSVLSYVYGHKGGSDTSINRIVALSGARCESGAYSQDTDCQHFPSSFIDSAGGCAVVKGEAAGSNQLNQPESGQALPQGSSANLEGNFEESTPTFSDESLELKNYNVFKESEAELQTKCRTAIMNEIQAVQTQMRGELSLDERNDLNDTRVKLRETFETC